MVIFHSYVNVYQRVPTRSQHVFRYSKKPIPSRKVTLRIRSCSNPHIRAPYSTCIVPTSVGQSQTHRLPRFFSLPQLHGTWIGMTKVIWHRCPFPIGWLINRGVWRNPMVYQTGPSIFTKRTLLWYGTFRMYTSTIPIIHTSTMIQLDGTMVWHGMAPQVWVC